MTTDDFCLCNKTYVRLAQGLELATNSCILFSDDIDHVINTCGGGLQYLVFLTSLKTIFTIKIAPFFLIASGFRYLKLSYWNTRFVKLPFVFIVKMSAVIYCSFDFNSFVFNEVIVNLLAKQSF